MVYQTVLAVAQVKPSKLSGDAFISFIEAKRETDEKPAAYAYLKVVNYEGLQDIGIGDELVPNRSIYMGDSLVLRISEAETSIQIYDLIEWSNAFSISVLSSKLVYDYYHLDDENNKWLIAACA